MVSFLLDKLSRVTSSQKFIPEVDGLRFIAIFTVVIYHLRTSLLRFGGFEEGILKHDFFFIFLSKGGLGVNLFFTISGFILALPFLRHFLYKTNEVKLGKYFIRRLTRLEPPYIIIMSLFFFLQIVVFPTTFQDLFPHYFASLFYVHFFIYGMWSAINPVAWSLETEVQFYVLAPLIALVFKIRRALVRFMVYGVMISAHTYFITTSTDSLSNLNLIKSIAYYFSNFFVGFVLADFFMLFKSDKFKLHWAYDILGIISFITLYYVYFKPGWINYVLFYLATAGIFLGTFKGILLNNFLTKKVITTIGGMCYTIYLIHYVFIFSVITFFGDFLFRYTSTFYEAFILTCITIVPVLLVLSALVFYFIEKPFMYTNWYSKWTFKQKRAE